MASNTGKVWAAYQATQKSGTGDWTALAIADNASAYSAIIDCSGYSDIIFGIGLTEDDTGAINGLVTVSILGDVDGTNFEEGPGLASAQVGNPYGFTVIPVQNDVVYVRFKLSVSDFDRIKINLLNEGGQILTTTVKHKFADVPAAVA